MTTTEPAWLPHWTAHANTPAHLRHLSPLLDWLGEQDDEDVYHAILDAHPDAHDVRRALGEWLSDRGDERGEGMVAMAACGLSPFASQRGVWVWFNAHFYGKKQCYPHHLPQDWYKAIGVRSVNWSQWPTRRAAEDAAALAFARLPAARRAALLRGELEG